MTQGGRSDMRCGKSDMRCGKSDMRCGKSDIAVEIDVLWAGNSQQLLILTVRGGSPA